jgi:hypothetical protein
MWSRNMPTKHLRTISLLLPLVAISATAQAGSTISDRSYWPSEARKTVGLKAEPQADANSAFAYDQTTSSLRPATNVIGGGAARPYQGGPKGH